MHGTIPKGEVAEERKPRDCVGEAMDTGYGGSVGKSKKEVEADSLVPEESDWPG